MNAGILEALFRLKDEVTPTLKQIQKTAKEVGKSLDRDLGVSTVQKLGDALTSNVGGKVAASVVAGAGAIAAGLAYATKSMLDLADQTSNLSAQTGIGVESLQRLALAGEPVGVSMEDAAAAVGKFQEGLVEGAEGFNSALGKLGLSRGALAGLLPEDQLQAVLVALDDKIPNAANRTAIAMELLGKSGAKLMPLGAELKNLGSAKGLIIDQQDIANADALGDSIGRLVGSFMLLVRNIGAVITSNASLHTLVDGLRGVFLVLTGEIKKNRASMQDLVSGGVELITSGLLLMVDAVDIANDAWTALKLTWKSASNIAMALAEMQLQARIAAQTPIGNATPSAQQQAVLDDLRAQLAIVREARLENSDAANADVDANARRADSIEKVRKALERVQAAVVAQRGKEIKVDVETPKATPAMLEAAKAAQAAFEALTKNIASATLAAEKELAMLATRSMTTLGAAFAAIDIDMQTKLAALAQSVQEAIAKGVDPAAANAAAEPLIALYARIAEAQKAAAFEGARKSALGETFGDAALAAASLLEITQKFGDRVKTLTTADLSGLVSKLIEAREAFRDVGDDEGAAQAQEQIEKAAQAVIERARAENDYIEVGNGLWMRRRQVVEDASEATAAAAKKRKEELDKQIEGMEELRSMFSDLIGILDDFGLSFLSNIVSGMDAGVAAAEKFAKATDDVGKALAVAQAAGAAFKSGNFLSGAATGAAFGAQFGPLGAVLGGIGGGVLGAIGGAIHKEEMEVNDLRDAFFEARGGFVALQESLARITNQDLVKQIFDAETVDDFNAATQKAQHYIEALDQFDAFGGWENAQRILTELGGQDLIRKVFDAKSVREFDAAVQDALGALGLNQEAQEQLNAAVERYGFEIEQLGPKFRQQELDKIAAGLIQDFRLLTASGIDQTLVLDKMSDAFSDYVQTAIAAGVALPEAMRPMIEQLIESGQLLDANGNAFTSIEQAGISFTETLTEGLTRLIDKIDQLVTALTGVGSAAGGIRIPNPDGAGTGGGGGGNGTGIGDKYIPSYDVGTPFVPHDQLAWLHRGEAVIPAGARTGNTAVSIELTMGDILIPPGSSLDPQQVGAAAGIAFRNNLSGLADQIVARTRVK